MKHKFKNLSLTGKLLVIYVLAGFVPVAITLGISYAEMKKILWQRETAILDSYLTQTTDAIDGELEIYNNLTNYISYNQSIARILSSEQSAYQNYEQFSNVVDPLLSSVMYFHDDVTQVTIYTDACDVKHGTTVMPLDELEAYESYYELTADGGIYWVIDREKKQAFSLSRMAMLEQKGARGFLYIGVDYDSVFQPFYRDTVFENYGIVVVSGDGACIYSKDMFSRDKSGYVLSEDIFDYGKETDVDGYQFIKKDSNAAGWSIWIYKPDRLIISSMRPIILVAVVALIVSLAAGVGCIRITSEFITKRIKRLQKTMKHLETDNLGAVMENDSEDEIGDLINGYNIMTKRLDATVNEVYRSKIKEKEYEMRALQAQINPHFLYNSLSMINWKALEAGKDDISRITLSLSTFYRTALNKGKNILLVRDEIANIKSYLDIQLAMHDGSFNVIYDIDESILKYETLNLILQPLLENAICHGIDVKPSGRGVIKLTGREMGELIELTVSDNGVGMTREQAEQILSGTSNGYGVSNVNERIKLYYGEEYAIRIESEPDKGTEVMLHFPKNIDIHKKST